MSGHPDFERAFRIQMNTLEWMPIFLPALWLFAIYIGDAIAAGDRRGLDHRPHRLFHRLFEGRRKARPGLHDPGHRSDCAVGGCAGRGGAAAGVRGGNRHTLRSSGGRIHTG